MEKQSDLIKPGGRKRSYKGVPPRCMKCQDYENSEAEDGGYCAKIHGKNSAIKRRVRNPLECPDWCPKGK